MLDAIIRPDKKWLEKIQAGGKEGQLAENKLYDKYAYFVKRGMTTHQLAEEDAVDAYIDAFTEAIRQVVQKEFRGDSSFKSYLFRIFNNRCVDNFRKKTTNKSRVHQWIDELSDIHHDSLRNTLQKMLDVEKIELLKRAIETLGNTCRQILWDTAMGYSLSEIALRLDPPLKNAATVKTQKYRCMNKLKEKINSNEFIG